MSATKRSHRFTYVFLIALVLFTFFSHAALTFAQSGDDSSSLEITGKVTRMSGLTITIGGVTFDLSQAEVYGSFKVGDVVRIKLMATANGALVVREVEPAVGNDNDNSNDNSNINSNDNRNSNDNSSANDNSNDNDNSNTNSNDNRDDNRNDNADDFDDDRFKLSGVISEIGDGYIVVSGIRVMTTNAKVEGQLTVGAAVEVRLTVVNNQYAALEVKPASGDDSTRLPADCVITVPAGWSSYAVRFGDTLSGIAAGSGMKLADLVALNCVTNPNRVAVGTILFVPRAPVMPDNSNDNTDDNRNDNHDDDNRNNNSNDNNDDSRNDNGDDDRNDNRDDDHNDNRDDDHNDNRSDNNDDHDDD